MRPATTADCTRSPRYLGKTTPRLGTPTWWPARPPRCRPLATAGGVGTEDTLGMDLVEPCAEAFREPAGVGEHDGGAVVGDEVDDALLDVRPDRRARWFTGGAAVEVAGRLPELGHVVDRDDHLELDPLVGRWLD